MYLYDLYTQIVGVHVFEREWNSECVRLTDVCMRLHELMTHYRICILYI